MILSCNHPPCHQASASRWEHRWRWPGTWWKWCCRGLTMTEPLPTAGCGKMSMLWVILDVWGKPILCRTGCHSSNQRQKHALPYLASFTTLNRRSERKADKFCPAEKKSSTIEICNVSVRWKGPSDRPHAYNDNCCVKFVHGVLKVHFRPQANQFNDHFNCEQDNEEDIGLV